MTNNDDPFAPTEEQREAIAADIAAAEAAGAQDWARIFTSHLDMRSLYAYLEDDDAVINLRDPTRVHSWKAFCNLTAGSTRLVVGPRGGERVQLIAKDWLEDRERLTVKSRTFQPNAPRITANLLGQRAVNMWSEPRILSVPLPEDWERRAEIFTKHLAYLIPDLTEHSHVLRWLAHIVQKPEELPGWHVLLIAKNTFGTGRNWIAHTMACIFPEHTVEDLPLKRLLEGKHNSEIERAVLGVVDEVHEGGRDQWEREQELRSFLTAKTRTINPKFIRPYAVRNFLRVLMFSNHIDALPIPEDDRRHYVANCTTVPRPKAYYDGLYSAIKDPRTLRAIHELLLRVDLRGFAIEGRAPGSATKMDMVVAARADEETELRRIMREWPSDIMLGAMLRKALQDFRDQELAFGEERSRSDELSTGQLRRLYRVCGVQRLGQLRAMPWELGLAEEPQDKSAQEHFKYRIVAIRNADFWQGRGELSWREEVTRGILADRKGEKASPNSRQFS